MTDIVERLCSEIPPGRAWCREAADEIKRLRWLADNKNAALNEAMAEVERLRAATIEECAKPLEQIRQVCADNAGEGSNHKMALDFVHQIAIRALKEKSVSQETNLT